MPTTRLARVMFFSFISAATLLGTLSWLPFRYRDEVAGIRNEVLPPASITSVSLLPPLSSQTTVLATQAIAKYCAAQPLRVSDHFHRWRFDGLQGAYSNNLELEREVGQVQNQSHFKKIFAGSPPLLFRSPYGWEVRQRTPKAARDHWEYEHHVDQFLATCAEIGVPVTFQIETDFGRVSIGELLDASRRSFDPSQELCWTLVAYCTYLPEEPQWTNRFGDLCSYDAIVEKILSLSLDDGSCGGTHKQFALAYCLAKVHLSSDLRRQCEQYLERSSRALERSQLSSGAWTPFWATPDSGTMGGPDSASIRGVDLVRITGHQLEWVCLAPPNVRPSAECLSRALYFLADALNRADVASIQKEYCAYSHAACMLQRAMSRELPSGSRQPSAAKVAEKTARCVTAAEGLRPTAQTP
ncbi:MAG TPA: hypothetical protein VFG04_06280 [Planctomycetaceae bacterium]|jgi:hypothetical protein|nr:hypothetical protein [Planctomycetaceae bacterium]